MALINCPDCGTEVSDAALACPKCARPIAAAVTHIAPPPPTPKKGTKIGSVLLAFLLVGGWVYYQSNQSQSPVVGATPGSSDAPLEAASSDSTSEQSPADDDRPAFVTTPADLYRAYSTNEVATDQSLVGKVVQFTAPVKSIDKDFTDSAVLSFATGDEFTNLQATLKDSDKAAAAQLTPGQVVTVRCQSFKRIIDSPMGNDCTFAVGGESSSASNQPAAASTAAATAPVEQASAPTAATADDLTPVSGESVSPAPQAAGANAAGPSFDCTQVTDAVDLTICSNTELSQLDQQMAALYFARAQSGTDPTARDEQRTWLHDRNQCGPDVTCLRKEYAARIQQLQ